MGLEIQEGFEEDERRSTVGYGGVFGQAVAGRETLRNSKLNAASQSSSTGHSTKDISRFKIVTEVRARRELPRLIIEILNDFHSPIFTI